MSTDPENLDPVVSLLKSKQAPHPPAAFFDQLSHRIRNGIQTAAPQPRPTWWQRVATDIDLKAGLTGVVVCAAMLFGLLYAMKSSPGSSFSTLPLVPLAQKNVITPPALPVLPDRSTFRPAAEPGALSATNTPVLIQSDTTAPFGTVAAPTAEPANFWPRRP